MPSLSVNNSNNRFTLTLTVTETAVNTSANTSTVSWSLDLKANTTYHFSSFAIGYSVSLNGNSVGYRARSAGVQYSISSNGSVNIAKGSGVTISHASDGTLSMPCSFSIDMNSVDYTPGPLSKSGTIALTTINRNASITIPRGVLGESQTISIDSGSSYTLEWTCGSYSGTIASNSTSSALQWTPSIELANAYPTSTYVQVVFYLTNAAGMKTVSAYYDIPDAAAPSVGFSLSDPNGHLNKIGAYVQGYSSLLIEAYLEGNYGASIKSCKITAEGQTFTTSTATIPILNQPGEHEVVVTATDSRGMTSSYTKKYTVLEYSAPTADVTRYRCNASGEYDDEGDYLFASFEASISSLNGVNAIDYSRLSYGKDGGDGGFLSIYFGTASSYDILRDDGAENLPELIKDETAVVKLTIRDKITTTTLLYQLKSVFVLMDFHESGKGVALGGVATKEGFDCGMKAYFQDDVEFAPGVKVTGLPSATLPVASTTTLGGVKVDGTTAKVDGNGVLSMGYELPAASASVRGGLRVDTDVFSITSPDGVKDKLTYVPKVATTSQNGVCRPDGSTITINNGVLSASSGGSSASMSKLVSYSAGTSATNYPFTPSNYNILLMGITPSSNGAMCTVAIPTNVLPFDFQVADETNFCKWTISSSGLSRVSGSGNIRYICGVKF